MSDSWFIENGGKRSGPYTPAQLKDLAGKGRLQPSDMVFRDGMENPVPAAKVKGLLPAKVSPPPSQVSPEVPDTPSSTLGVDSHSTTEKKPAPSLLGKFSTLPRLQKGVAVLGVGLVGFCLFSAVVGVIMSLAGVKPSGSTKSGKAVIKHEPYTEIVMPSLPASRIHEISGDDKSEYGKLTPVVRVKDVSEIDFTQGPDGEPIEMDQVKWKEDGMLRTQSYFYRDKAGKKVFHGPLTSYKPGGKDWNVTVYIFGTPKFGQSFQDGQNLVPEVYRGDDHHKGVTYTLYDNKSLKSVYPYYKRHKVTETEDQINSVAHGRELIFWDNTVLMAIIKKGVTELAKDIGGVQSEYTWEHGKRVRRREFKRNGEMSFDGK